MKTIRDAFIPPVASGTSATDVSTILKLRTEATRPPSVRTG